MDEIREHYRCPRCGWEGWDDDLEEGRYCPDCGEEFNVFEPDD